MNKQKYKIEYTDSKNKLTKVFFVDRPFNSALKQAKTFIKRNTHLNIKLLYKNWSSKYNFGWKQT